MSEENERGKSGVVSYCGSALVQFYQSLPFPFSLSLLFAISHLKSSSQILFG